MFYNYIGKYYVTYAVRTFKITYNATLNLRFS